MLVRTLVTLTQQNPNSILTSQFRLVPECPAPPPPVIGSSLTLAHLSPNQNQNQNILNLNESAAHNKERAEPRLVELRIKQTYFVPASWDR